MQTLKFDPEAYKTQAISDPFKTRAALEAACEKIYPVNVPYNLWARKHGVDQATGSIITTAYNPDLLNRRAAALESQLNEFKGGPASGLSYTIPPNLLAAFDSAAKVGAAYPFKVLMVSTTRENLHFDLQATFPQLNIQTVTAAPDKDYADRCNGLIQATAPELSESLVYKSDWQGQAFDLVAVNPAVLYKDKTQVEQLVVDIARSGAKRVVFSNLVQNDDPDGAEQWKGQRYSGGIIPLRVPARGELAALMQKIGYSLVEEEAAPATFDVSRPEFTAQNPALDNLSFIRN